MALTFDQARASVLREVAVSTGMEPVPVLEADGRFLAESVTADRDYPPFPRSARDGFAVRADDLPGQLRVIGEVRAGERFAGKVHEGEAVEIMTGAPLPDGANAVVMVEHCVRAGDRISIEKTAVAGDNFNPKGSEAQRGQVVLTPGQNIGFTEIALLATVGRTQVIVYKQPRVAILPTGDEVVEAGDQPLDFQIRNSNALSLASQVKRAGGIPEILPIARDNIESTQQQIEVGLQADLLLLSGGVSAGKYDIVEKVLAGLGAEFFFDRVLLQPGQPVVFGKARGKFFFGLPGNPGSTMITFEVFARAAIERMQGCAEPALPVVHARLTRTFRHKPGLTRFLPARLTSEGITPEPSQGSGDVFALARANAFLVTETDRETWAAGDYIRVLLK